MVSTDGSDLSEVEWDRRIVMWLATKRLPFSFFDDEDTQQFFNAINPSINFPKKDSMRRKVESEYVRMKGIMKNVLKSNTSKISFTVDGWTSCNFRSYYGITAHFIDENWSLQSLTLDFVPSGGRHTGKDIATVFFTSLIDFDIASKIQGITLDNAASNTTFISELKTLLQESDISFNTDDQHFRCFAHILNLGVQDILKLLQHDADQSQESSEDSDSECSDDESTIHSPVLKLRLCIRKIRKSEQLTNKLKSSCEATNTRFFKPTLDVRTRWNSTFDMIQTSLELRLALDVLTANVENLRKFKISEEEWRLLEKVCGILKYFKSVSKLLSGDKYVTLPVAVVAFNILLDRLENHINTLNPRDDLSDAEEQVLNSCISGRSKLLKHYSKTNWIYCASLILDPRHKVEGFNLSSWGREMKEKSIDCFEKLFKNCYYHEISENAEEDADTLILTEEDDINLDFLYEERKLEGNWRREIDEYIAQKRASREENILLWWKRNEKSFPNIAQMARDILSTTATSVPSERLFSQAGLVVSKARSRLTDDATKWLLTIQSWATSSLKEYFK